MEVGTRGTIVGKRGLDGCRAKVLQEWSDRLTVVLTQKFKTYSKGDTFYIPLKNFVPDSR
jgi:hypothetical protein